MTSFIIYGIHLVRYLLRWANTAPKVQDIFWHLGEEVLNLAYKGSIYDQSVKLNDPTSEDDNLDILHETATKLNIISPILRPQIKDSLANAIGDYCVGALKDVMATFLPTHRRGDAETSGSAHKIVADKKMDWLKKFLPVSVVVCVRPDKLRYFGSFFDQV